MKDAKEVAQSFQNKSNAALLLLFLAKTCPYALVVSALLFADLSFRDLIFVSCRSEEVVSKSGKPPTLTCLWLHAGGTEILIKGNFRRDSKLRAT